MHYMCIEQILPNFPNPTCPMSSFGQVTLVNQFLTFYIALDWSYQ